MITNQDIFCTWTVYSTLHTPTTLTLDTRVSTKPASLHLHWSVMPWAWSSTRMPESASNSDSWTTTSSTSTSASPHSRSPPSRCTLTTPTPQQLWNTRPLLPLSSSQVMRLRLLISRSIGPRICSSPSSPSSTTSSRTALSPTPLTSLQAGITTPNSRNGRTPTERSAFSSTSLPTNL